MKTYLLCILFIVIVTGCKTNTITMPAGNGKIEVIKRGIDFEISVEDGPSSKITKYFPNGFCGLGFDTKFTKVNLESEWNPYSRISFLNSDSSKRYDLLFYYNRSTLKLDSLIKHSDDVSAEPLDVSFDLNEKMKVMIYVNKTKVGISVEVAWRIENIYTFVLPAEKTVEFHFSEADIDFIPTKVSFLGVSSSSLIENIIFRTDC
ncbi:hypothetical protein ACUR5C_15755 [Aliikangiella sp. IMCC44653]